MANAKIIVTRLDNGMPEVVYVDSIRSISSIGGTQPAPAKGGAKAALVPADGGTAEIHWRTTGLLAVQESQKEVDALIG